MQLDWSDTPPETVPHPRLDPVAAWNFERDSAFLRMGDPRGDTAWLYSMAIDAAGFNPGFGETWRALGVPNPNDPGAAQAAFSLTELADELNAVLDAVPDARVDVVPIRAGGILSPEALIERMDIASPPGGAPPPRAPAPQAIIGIIDHGINVFHHRFRRGADMTRVTYFWDQAAEKATDNLPFGREWHLNDIEAALAETSGDEDALLRLLGADMARPGFRPLAYRASHGTHVLDLAAGFEPDDVTGAAFPIIAVNMPAEVSRETSGSMLSLPFCLGLSYIADRARWIFHRYGVVVPVYVNFSFGLTGGPRGGLHRLERTVANVADVHRTTVQSQPGFETAQAPFTLVTAAGNNNLAQGHARARPGEERLDLLWQIEPADTTPNVVELRIALPPGPVGNTSVGLELALTPPGSATVDPLVFSVEDGSEPARLFWLRRDGASIGHLSAVGAGDGVLMLTLIIAATDPALGGKTPAPSGTWGVSLRAPGVVPERIDAWILRDDVPVGFRDTGRQSRFLDPGASRFTPNGYRRTEDTDPQAVVRHAGSLNALATRARPLADPAQPQDALVWVVGAAQATTALPGAPIAGAAPYSAAPLDGSAERIDLSALGDLSQATPGILAAGTRSGSRVALSGTSVAAPQVVRFLAVGQGALGMADGAASPRLGPVLQSPQARRGEPGEDPKT